MQKNVGGIFAALRVVGGLLLLGGALWSGYVGWTQGSTGLVMVGAAAAMGAFMVITGIIRRCPINRALDQNTCR